MIRKPIQFHWTLPMDGEKVKASQATISGVPDFDAMIEFSKIAEEAGIESLLMPFGFHMPDPIPLVSILAPHTNRIKFLIAYRAGIISPTLFTQQLNTLSHFVRGRIALNMIAGTSPSEQAQYGDFANHDQRLKRAAEFLQICRELWDKKEPVDFDGEFYQVKGARLQTPFFENLKPQIYWSGNSALTEGLASKYANTWLRYADTPEKIKAAFAVAIQQGTTAGLRMSIIARQSHSEAIQAANQIVANPDLNWLSFVKKVIEESDSVAVRSTFSLANNEASQWLVPNLWTGAVPFRGGPAITLVGSYEEISERIMEFKNAGVSEFIFSGWTNRQEIKKFAHEILPRVRLLEAKKLKLQEGKEIR
jgi:alkanesulfonate monooxygenase